LWNARCVVIIRAMAKTQRKHLGFLPHWRVFTYVILVANILALLELTTVRGASGDIVLAFVLWYLVFWFLADALLGFLWLATKPGGSGRRWR